MLSTRNKHYNTEYQSTDKSYKTSGVTPRKCFCRRCNGKYLTNSNPENFVSNKSIKISEINDRLIYKKLQIYLNQKIQINLSKDF